MYTPPTTALSIAEEDQGVWAPRIHQRVIARLITGLTQLFDTGEINLEALPETILDESRATAVPDISLYDNAANVTPVIIEVCHTDGRKSDLQKVIKLIDADLYGIREGFVYDYRTGHWLRYCFGNGGLTETASWSAILGLDLNRFAMRDPEQMV